MENRKIRGQKGEEMAVLFLKRIGFQIIALNWRCKNLEVDIIAMEGEMLVFVEVKYRSSGNYGDHRDLISTQKMHALFRAAQAYLEESTYEGEIRFDVVCFVDNKLNYIKDAFWKY